MPRGSSRDQRPPSRDLSSPERSHQRPRHGHRRAPHRAQRWMDGTERDARVRRTRLHQHWRGGTSEDDCSPLSRLGRRTHAQVSPQSARRRPRVPTAPSGLLAERPRRMRGRCGRESS
eukprot:scaffold1650_cov351-Prasinococcus_capsulatus_cf.AAC.2